MADLPKIVQSRLRQQTMAGLHPDANLLTAFAEQALRGDERERVLAHLATCADCRDVVALAQPEIDTSQVLAMPQRHWFARWKLMQWSAAAAGIVIVAGTVLMLRPKQGPLNQVASQIDTMRSAGPQKQADIAPAPADNTREKQTGRDAEADAFVDANASRTDEVKARAKSADAVATKPKREESVDGKLLADNQSAQEIKKIPGGITRGAIGAPANGRVAGFGMITGNRLGKVAEMPVPASAKPVAPAATAVDKFAYSAASPAATAQNSGTAPVMANAAKSAEQQKDMSLGGSGGGVFRKKQPLNEEKAKARSEVVEVTGESGLVTAQALNGRNVASLLSLEAPQAWRVWKHRVQHINAKSEWKPVDLPTTAKMNVVAAQGPTVLVAGDNGTVYASSDSGTTWSVVSGGWGKADITGITLAGTFVQMKTDSGETWVTKDLGKSWTKQ